MSRKRAIALALSVALTIAGVAGVSAVAGPGDRDRDMTANLDMGVGTRFNADGATAASNAPRGERGAVDISAFSEKPETGKLLTEQARSVAHGEGRTITFVPTSKGMMCWSVGGKAFGAAGVLNRTCESHFLDSGLVFTYAVGGDSRHFVAGVATTDVSSILVTYATGNVAELPIVDGTFLGEAPAGTTVVKLESMRDGNRFVETRTFEAANRTLAAGDPGVDLTE